MSFLRFDTAIEVRLTVSDDSWAGVPEVIGTLSGGLGDGAGTFVSLGQALYLQLDMLPTSTGLQLVDAAFTCVTPTTVPGTTPEGYVWENVPQAHLERSPRLTRAAFDATTRVSAVIPLASAFPFYGGTFSAMVISADGYVVFGDPGSKVLVPIALPSASVPVPMIAVFWATSFRQAMPGANGWMVSHGEVASAVGVPGTVVLFEGVPVGTSDATATFQLTLWSNGRFQIALLDTASAWTVSM